MSISKIKIENVEHELEATKLVNARNIDGISFNGTANVIRYATCSTAAAVAAKTVACTGFTLVTGASIKVRFTVTNTAAVANLTLNVNSTGAKSIKYRNANLGAAGYLAANRIYEFVYDGTYWQIVGDIDTNTTNVGIVTCTTAAATAAKVGSTNSFTLANNRYFFVNISNANTAASALTLNINSTGAKPIYINGTASSASNYTLPVGIYFVYYNGTNYYFRTDGNMTANITGNATTATSATSATKATQDASGNVITSTYETKTDSASKLTEAKTYTDSALDSYVKLSGNSNIAGSLLPYSNGTYSLGTSSLKWNTMYANTINPNSIEFIGSTSHGGYIDFHYGSSTADNTSRIIESASGVIDIVAPNGIKFNSGALSVVNGGTGATTLTSGRALIGAGTGAVTTRAITNNTATSSAITGSTNLVTMNTLKNAINRTTSVAAADTNYTTYMARGSSLNATETTPTVNGAIAWVYE